MSQSKREILKLFEADVTEASTDVPDDGVLSEYDDVLIVYRGHYPEYREDFDEILNNSPKFFDFGLDNE